MKLIHTNLLARVGHSFVLGLVTTVLLGTPQLRAASGSELLMSSLSSSEMNKTVVECDSLKRAVTKAVTTSKEQAPEIVAVAITKTRSLACQKTVLQASIVALGNYKSLPKNLIPNIVGAAIRASSNCSYATKEDAGYVKSDTGTCECAEAFTKAAIEAIADPSERLVVDITAAAVQATGGKCSERIAAAATSAAPQFASVIADAAARASNTAPGAGPGDIADNAQGDPLVFGPTGSVLPSAFTVPSTAPGVVSAVVAPTTPVN